jgi:type I restriction enzyme S subunit
MSDAWLKVPLAEVLRHRKQFITIDDLTAYKRCRVQLHAQGIVLRDQVPGSQINTKTQQVCRAGEFLVAEIDAKMGGFGIVPPELDGAIVSSHYFLFETVEERLDRRFLGWYCKTPAFREQVRAQGTTNYAAIRPAHVLAYTIPLPPLAEQRRIVARLDALAAKIEEAKGLNGAAASEISLARSTLFKECYQTSQGGRVGDHISFQSGYAFKSEWFTPDGLRLARNVNVGHGQLNWSEAARIPESRRSEFHNFDLREGDILVSLDRPIISTGVKVARVRACDLPALLLQRVGRARFKDSLVTPEFFFGWLRSPWFAGAIDPGRSNGVPHISPGDIERIPFSPPPLAEQLKAVKRAASLEAAVEAAWTLQNEANTEIEALIPSVLNRAFAGAL